MLKFHRVLDVTTGSSAHTNCFTKVRMLITHACDAFFSSRVRIDPLFAWGSIVICGPRGQAGEPCKPVVPVQIKKLRIIRTISWVLIRENEEIMGSTDANASMQGYRKNYFAAGSLFASDDFARDFCEESHDGRLLISEDGRSRLAEQDSASISACDQVRCCFHTSILASSRGCWIRCQCFPQSLSFL